MNVVKVYDMLKIFAINIGSNSKLNYSYDLYEYIIKLVLNLIKY